MGEFSEHYGLADKSRLRKVLPAPLVGAEQFALFDAESFERRSEESVVGLVGSALEALSIPSGRYINGTGLLEWA
jgi:hypothetical protein